jgi:DNA-binding response OmpR family regulator
LTRQEITMAKLSGKILIVDDENPICDLLSHLVSREGLSPLVAQDGNTALKIIWVRLF